MRRWLVLIIQWVAASAALLLLAACGGGSSTPKTSGPGIPSTVTLSPTSVGVTRGLTVPFSASVVDINSSPVTNQVISFQSSNTAVLTVANSGLACAGTWDSLTTPVVCTPGPSGSAQVTAISGTLTSSAATVFVHDKVDTVVVSPANPSCVSNGALLQFTAKAFAAGKDITSQVGPISWNTTQATVANIDQTGLATAVIPGAGGIFASVNGVNAATVPFVTCPIVGISLLTSAGGTSFATDNATTQTLVATATDSSGATLANASNFLTLSVGTGAVGSMSATTFAASVPGTTSIATSCTPPNCNIGMTPVYGNAMVGSVNGSSATAVYVASPSSTSLIPIDTTTNTAGTAITLPTKPNSLFINSQGTKAFLGSDTLLMVVDLTVLSVSTIGNVSGTVIGVAPDGNKVLMSNTVNQALYVIDSTTGGVESFLAPGVLRAAFSPDGYKAFLVGSNTLFTYSPVLPFRSDVLPAVINDAAFLASGAVGFLAGGTSSAVTGRLTCNSAQVASLPFPSTPSRIAALPDGSGMVAVDNSSLYLISASVQPGTSPCPPTVSASIASKTNLNAGVFAPKQLLLTPSGNRALILSDQPQILVYNLISGTPSAIPLAGAATVFSGGITLDSNFAYVGASDGNVHLIDLNALTDTSQVSVGFTPNLVAVRPH